MRLLNTSTGRMKEFMSDEEVPRYAILSHTWRDGEISLRDWEGLSPAEVHAKLGYLKIKFMCDQAKSEGYHWVWVDTCCIDKSSSAELSEAINSMFRWYQKAAVCYVYLSDIADPASSDLADIVPTLSQSRWFTRGWTLQELIAPEHVVFYSCNWHRLGSKTELCGFIAEITGIDEAFLRGQSLATASISKRMSWAANRNTTRPEDIAYSLLGIFDINMPLLYGEGMKAFTRLQMELMKAHPHDHTLFAWGVVVNESSLLIPVANREGGSKADQWKPPVWSGKDASRSLQGLLADSPKDFEESGDFIPLQLASICYTYPDPQSGTILSLPTARGRGFHVHFPVTVSATKSLRHWKNPRMVQVRILRILYLLCGNSADPTKPGFIGIPIQPWGTQCYGRTRDLVIGHSVSSSYWDLMKMSKTTYIEPEVAPTLQDGDLVFRRVNFLNSNHWTDDGKIGYSHSFLWGDGVVTRGFGKTSEFRLSYDYKPLDSKSKGAFGVGIFVSRDKGAPHGVVSFVFRWVKSWDSKSSPGWERPPPEAQDLSTRCTMANPLDAWQLVNTGVFPDVRVETEMMELDDGKGFVHAIDVIFTDKPGTPNIPAPPAGGSSDKQAAAGLPSWTRVASIYQRERNSLRRRNNT